MKDQLDELSQYLSVEESQRNEVPERPSNTSRDAEGKTRLEPL